MTDALAFRSKDPVRAPGMPLSLLLAPWVMLRQVFLTRYRATPDYVVTFPPMAGRPGFGLRSYSLPPDRPYLHSGGGLTFGDLRVSDAGSRLVLTSRGHVSRVGSAPVVLQEAMSPFARPGFRPCAPLVTHVGGEPAWAASVVLSSGTTISEVRWERAGWIFGAGVVASAAATDLQPHVRTVLDSWTWLDGVTPTAPR